MQHKEKKGRQRYINEIMAQVNDTEMYSLHNEEKSVAVERFIGTLIKNTNI